MVRNLLHCKDPACNSKISPTLLMMHSRIHCMSENLDSYSGNSYCHDILYTWKSNFSFKKVIKSLEYFHALDKDCSWLIHYLTGSYIISTLKIGSVSRNGKFPKSAFTSGLEIYHFYQAQKGEGRERVSQMLGWGVKKPNKPANT